MSNHAQPHPPTERADHQRRAFHTHAAAVAASMLVIGLVNAALNAAAGILTEWWAWWSVLALLGWGIGLSVHGLVLRVHTAGGPAARHTASVGGTKLG